MTDNSDPASPNQPPEPDSSPLQYESPDDSPDSTTPSPDASSTPIKGSSPLLSSPRSDDPIEPKRKRYEFDYEAPEPKTVYWPSATKATCSIGDSGSNKSSPLHNDQSQSENMEGSATSSAAANTDHPEDVTLPCDGASSGSVVSGTQDNSNKVSSESSSSSVISSDEEDKEDEEEHEEMCDETSQSSQEEDDIADCGDQIVAGLKIYEGSNLTVDEGVTLLMDLYMTQKLSKTTLEYMLKLIQKFLPDENNMPQSKHTLFKYVQDACPPAPFKVHFYCQTCLFYIGEQANICHLCEGTSKKFYQLSLAHQIKSLFENQNLAEIINKYSSDRSSRQVAGKYFDLCDGSEYLRVQVPGKYNLTLLGHTDGVSITNSSHVTLWPLEFVICEIPPHLRFKFVLISGVWVDSCKPNMHCYLEPFAQELLTLSSDGVTWRNPQTQSEEKTLAVAPLFCGDAPVRANLQNILEVAGKRSCNGCEQKTVKLPPEPILPGIKKTKRKRVFVLKEEASTLRTAERMEAQGKACLEIRKESGKTVPQKGVKGMSVLFKFPQCDPSKAVYPEYMHGILGIIKQFMELWFEMTGLDYCSLKQYRDEIDSFLEHIKEPDFVTRCPKSTRNFTEWKANDCRSFLLYVSLPALSKYMSSKHLQHWMLFVEGVYLLLQECVSEIDVQKADVMFKMFLRDFSKLYTYKSLTYNLHNLSHYASTVKVAGPLWSNSAFFWEDFNGKLEERIHGTKNQGIELVKTVQLFQGVQVLKARVETLSSRACEGVAFLFRNVIQSFRFTDIQKRMLSSSNLVPKNVFYRAIAVSSGKIFTCVAYARQKIKNNFTICFSDNFGNELYGEIVCFVECSDDTKMAFVQCFVVEHDRMFIHESGFVVKHIIPIRESCELHLIPMSNVRSKVMRVDSYVCIRPNKYEANL